MVQMSSPSAPQLVELKAKVPSVGSMPAAEQAKFTFEVDAIGNSTFAWDAANPAGTATASGDFITATATFTGLPQNNTDFGLKKARVKHGGNNAGEAKFEVFFPKDAENHPELGPYQNGRPQNWFKYWRDGGVCGIPADAKYDSSADYGYVIPSVDRFLRLGPLASGSNNGPETFNSQNTYGVLTVTGHGKGIQCVAETAQHELNHIAIFDDAVGKSDRDKDGVGDASEATFDGVKSNPSDGDTFRMRDFYGSTYATYGDNEIRCRKKELNLTIQYYPKQDWSNPGCQSKNQFGPKP
jgi:hypothetical protein